MFYKESTRNWILAVEAITTMDLDGISSVLVSSVTSKELEDHLKNRFLGKITLAMEA